MKVLNLDGYYSHRCARHCHHWSSTLGQLAKGEANEWFNAASPALIMIGEALREKQREVGQVTIQTAGLEGSSTKFDDGLQDGLILANSRRCT